MGVLLLEPHQLRDDAVLFAAYTCCAFSPHVITILASQLQEERGTGITNGEREFENRKALQILGCTNEQWEYPDNNPDWAAIEVRLAEVRRADSPEILFAPAFEEDGHEQHNIVAEIAHNVFGHAVRPYLTYRRGHGKTQGTEVIPEPAWIVAKMKALACFGSQIREPTTRPWFLGDLREWAP